MPSPSPLHLCLIAGEPSGDELGAHLMSALRAQSPHPLRFSGVGGDKMQAAGLSSLFPLSDIAIMGVLPVLRHLPRLLHRLYHTIHAVQALKPDAVVLIDSPDFTHRVAKSLRQKNPLLPVFDYVSPSVWAWRSGRARHMRAYIDHVLALLPFEPEAYIRLQGPPCTYVGHPLLERLPCLQGSLPPTPTDRPPVVLIMPGSRRQEVDRLLEPFYGALLYLSAHFPSQDLEFILPTLPYLKEYIESKVKNWNIIPKIVCGESEKYEAFGRARAALVASGTATLELALAHIPMVAAYHVSKIEEILARHMLQIPSILLPNLILNRPAFPEYLQEKCTAFSLGKALLPLLQDSKARHAQLEACIQVEAAMGLPGGKSPSEEAAHILWEHLNSIKNLSLISP